jgi:hypothetical protein
MKRVMDIDSTASAGLSHEMACQAETATEVLFVCTDETCGRRVVVGKGRPHLVVIERGDFAVRHTGSLGGAAVDEVTAA